MGYTRKQSKHPIYTRFNINDVIKCGAKTRTETKCKAPAMKNGRCRMHGGKSTGARTKEGIEKLKLINLKHGHYTKENIGYRKIAKSFIKESNKSVHRFV